MFSIQEMLKKKAEEVEAKETELNSPDTEEASVAEGEEGFVESALTTIADALATAPTAFLEAANYTPPVGAFRAIRLASLVLANGIKITPNIYGFYEEVAGEVKDLLNYYAEKGLVEEVTE